MMMMMIVHDDEVMRCRRVMRLRPLYDYATQHRTVQDLHDTEQMMYSACGTNKAKLEGEC